MALNVTFLQEILNSIAESGRSLLDRLVNHVQGGRAQQPLFDDREVQYAADYPLWSSTI